jgi:hypothetical protein
LKDAAAELLVRKTAGWQGQYDPHHGAVEKQCRADFVLLNGILPEPEPQAAIRQMSAEIKVRLAP